MTTEFASNAKANAGLATGIIGTALGALNGGLGMLGNAAGYGAYNNGYGAQCGHHDHSINRYEMEMALGYLKEIQGKDLQISALESERISDKKDAEVYAQLRGEIKDAYDRLDRRVCGVEGAVQAQAVWNAGMQSTIACIKNQVDQMSSLFALKIPNTSVCPGWGEVTTSVVTGAAAGA